MNYYRQNLLKRSFSHIAFVWERDISHLYPSVKSKVTESARYVTHTQLRNLSVMVYHLYSTRSSKGEFYLF